MGWPNGPRRLVSLVAVAAMILATVTIGAPQAMAAETPLPNPPIAKACGIDVTLILDASGSVQSSGAVGAVRDAAAAFLDALQNTGSTVRMIQFATIGQQLAPRAVVTTESLEAGGVFAQAIKGYYNPQPPRPSTVEIKSYRGSGDINSPSSWTSSTSIQYTNWNQVLDQTGTDPGDLVVFITDGDPTSYDFNRPTDPFDHGPPADVAINTDRGPAAASTLDRAVQSANGVKAKGARMLAVGVGAALQNQASVDRLIQVSGPNVARTTADFDIETTDVALVSDFDDLAQAVRELVLALCSPSLTIRKFAQSADDASYQPAPGWNVQVTPTVTDGTFGWILPAGNVGPSANLTTDSNGFAQFQWEPTSDTATSSANVVETSQPNFVAGRPDDPDYRCQFKNVDGDVRVVSGEFTGTAFTLTPIGDEIGTCSMWNSFAYAPAIALTKTNAPTDVRGDLTPAAQVTSTYQVTNPGNTPLDNVFITDDRCGPVLPTQVGGFNSGDTNQDNRLDLTETWTFTCVRSLTTSQDPAGGLNIVNTATVHGTDPAGTNVTATDSDDVTVFVPGIELTKLVNGVDQTSVPGDPPTEVTYTYRVANTGNTPLGTPTLIDDTPPCESPTRGADAPGNSDNTLDVGETWTYSCTAAPTASVVNTATVSAVPLNPNAGNAPFAGTNPPVTDVDTAAVTIVDPGLEFTKTVDRDVVFPGTPVTYSYSATNTGTTDLQNDTGNPGWVADDSCSPVVQVPNATGDTNVGDLNVDTLINPGETWQFECTAVIDDLTINVATIVAQPVAGGEPVGEPLTRIGVAVVEIVIAGLELAKTALVPVVLDPDATPFLGPDVPTPRPAEYLYEVANTGDVPIENVVLGDDTCAALTPVPPATNPGDSDADGNLDVDEVWTYTCSTPLTRTQATPPPTGAESGLVTNTATVTGNGFLPSNPDEKTGAITDTDIAQVLVIEPSLTLTKTASAAVVRAGDPVTYTVAVTNTGDVGLNLVGPIDDKCGDLAYTDGDLNNNGLLDGANSGSAETWTYQCTRPVDLPAAPATSDVNDAGVLGIDPLGNLYVAEDTAEVKVIDPAIKLVKTVSQPLVPSGTQVTYGFDVTNVGRSAVAADDVLAQVILLDVAEPANPACAEPVLVAKDGGNQDDLLDRDPPEVWRYACAATITAPTTNVAVVGALGGTTNGLELPVVDLAAAFVQPFTPAISVLKTAEPTTLLGGGAVTYTYQVRNTGDVPLAGVADRITDDTCSPVTYVSGDDDADGLLDTPNSIFEDAADETWIFTCTTDVTQTTTNTVVVTGTPTDGGGEPLCGPTTTLRAQVAAPCDTMGQATATVTVAQPGTITIVKKTTTPSATAFAFTIGGQAFTLANGESRTVSGLAPGSYTASESLSTNWRLAGIVCVDPTGDTVVDVAGTQATLALGDGESITCTFTNAAIVTPVNPDQNLPDTGLGLGWQVLVSGLGLLWFGAFLTLVARRRRA